MIAGIVGGLVRALVTASVDQQGGAQRRAYYNGVVTTIACLPMAIFVFFFVAGIWGMVQGSGSAWQIVLIGLGMTAGYGFLLARQIIGREAVWDERGVRFRWLGNEANLAWSEIEKVEMRRHSRNYARIRFKDGRTFGIGAQCTGCNALLHALGQRGVPFHKWGTSEPLNVA